MSTHKATGGSIFTPTFMLLGIIVLIGLYFVGVRFIHGIGSVTALNGGHPWGIWVVYDIVVGTALACGGYALAITIYILNKGQYHPLMRGALAASLMGYALAGVSALIDIGRYMSFYNLFLPWHMNFNSVMLEVSLCVTTYTLVLFIEFSPALLERLGWQSVLKVLNKVLFFFIALGLLLPTMHQSSLGSLLILMGYKIAPLWQSLQFQPVFALLTVLAMGFSIVIFEASVAAAAFRRPSEMPLLVSLSKAIIGLLIVYLVLRFGEIILRGKLGLAFALDYNSILFLLETTLFVIPLVVLLSPSARNHSNWLLLAAVSMLFAGSLYRFNAFLFTFNPGPGYSYFPSVPEIMVTLGIIAIEIMAYLVFVKTLPIMHAEKA